MSWPSSRTPALLAALTFLSLSRLAQAAPCGRPDVDLTFPHDGAVSVPNNAILAAHYGAPALYDDEPVSLKDSSGNSIALTATFDDADSMLRATPDEPLPSGHFDLVWPALRGVSGGGGLGRGGTVGFSVSELTDATPPTFAGLTGIEWDLSREKDPCLDRLDDRFVFKLQVGQASDDSGSGLLSLLVFETRNPTTPDQTEPSRVGVRAWPEDGQIEIRRPAKKAGKTCFAAIAMDLVGSVSGGGEREVCVTTQKPPFFDGCSLAAPGRRAPSAPSGAWFALLGLALLRRGRPPHARMPRAV